MFGKNKTKYIVIFVRQEGFSYVFLKRQVIKPDALSVNYGKLKHPIFLEHHTYRKDNKKFYFIEIFTGQLREKEGTITYKKNDKNVITMKQIIFSDSKFEYNPEILHMITDGNTLKQLTSTLNAKLLNGNTIFLFIVGVVAGIFAGFFIAGFF